MSDDEQKFRKALKWAPHRPEFRGQSYVFAVAILLVGVVCVVVAKSSAIFWSGWILVAVAALFALRGFVAARHWG